MSAPVPSPSQLAAKVAAATASALDSYHDLAAELVRLRDRSPAEQAVGLEGLRRASRELGVGLVVLARTVDVALGSGRPGPGEDPRALMPLLRALSDSLVMLDAPDWQTLVSRPIASPAELERLARAGTTRRILARAAV